MSHDFHPSILREYDIRGVVGETLTETDARFIGWSFGTVIGRDGAPGAEAGSGEAKTVAVGYDGRLSSPVLEEALVEGLQSAGVDVIRVGRGPTPMLYYAAQAFSADGGVMITGSHNPPNYNGFKFVKAGAPFFGDDIQSLGALAKEGDLARGEGGAGHHDIREEYVTRLIQDFTGNGRLRVAWDPGNGAAGEVLTRLIGQLPGEHFVINGDIDGTFPAHHPDPTVEKNLAQLKDLVARETCDLGIGFDGDGDRIGVIDSRGRPLWGDQLLVVLAREVLAERPGAEIICDVKASQAFFDEIVKLGGKPMMWRTGHSHIKAKMSETGAPLAGEMSAHIFFKDRYYGYDDALYAAIRLLNVLGATHETLAAIHDGLPDLPSTPEIRFACDDERKFQVIDEIEARLGSLDGARVSKIDGVRVETADGWWLLRASNTQPVLVARCEGYTPEALSALKTAAAEQLRLSGIDVPGELAR